MERSGSLPYARRLHSPASLHPRTCFPTKYPTSPHVLSPPPPEYFILYARSLMTSNFPRTKLTPSLIDGSLHRSLTGRRAAAIIGKRTVYRTFTCVDVVAESEEGWVSTHLRLGRCSSRASSPLARLIVPAAKGRRWGGVKEDIERNGQEKGEGACSEELHGGRSGWFVGGSGE